MQQQERLLIEMKPLVLPPPLLPVAAVLMEYGLQAMRLTGFAQKLLLLLLQMALHPGWSCCGSSGEIQLPSHQHLAAAAAAADPADAAAAVQGAVCWRCHSRLQRRTCCCRHSLRCCWLHCYLH
jgi:hypothetical protein